MQLGGFTCPKRRVIFWWQRAAMNWSSEETRRSRARASCLLTGFWGKLGSTKNCQHLLHLSKFFEWRWNYKISKMLFSTIFCNQGESWVRNSIFHLYILIKNIATSFYCFWWWQMIKSSLHVLFLILPGSVFAGFKSGRSLDNYTMSIRKNNS